MICSNITYDESGRLYFASQEISALAQEYGTPLYLMDEDRIRANMRMYRNAMQKHFGAASKAIYAGKAASFRQMYRIAMEEGMGIDVVSCGEICTAKSVGFDLSEAYFHSNNKTDADIAYAIGQGIGYFVVDNTEELFAIDRCAAEMGKRQKILLRITPGIDTHTYEAVNTGLVDSKFGSAIETGQAEEITRKALRAAHIDLIGFHCHVGSQVFEEDVFERSAEVMLRFMAHIREVCGYTANQLNLGGGYGVRYVESDASISIEKKIGEVAAKIREVCSELNCPMPFLVMEPGRSIVADAGMTVYTVGTVKRIPGYKSYVSVDGGMTDNPRYALYGSKYTVLTAEKGREANDECYDVVGRCCESGDIIQPKVMLPHSMQRGDVLAVCTTGAYNYSMASNYNRIPRPPVVMLSQGEHRLAVRRETLDDLIRNDL